MTFAPEEGIFPGHLMRQLDHRGLGDPFPELTRLAR
jgi:hypothetical protein